LGNIFKAVQIFPGRPTTACTPPASVTQVDHGKRSSQSITSTQASSNNAQSEPSNVHVTFSLFNSSSPKLESCSLASRRQLSAVRPTGTCGVVDDDRQACTAFLTVSSLHVPLKNAVNAF